MITPEYGKCPKCGGGIAWRERRLNGNDGCENGHVFPSIKAYLADDYLTKTTEEWLHAILRRSGFKDEGDWLIYETEWGSVSCIKDTDTPEMKIESIEKSGPWVPIPTRGDVRRLCRALGIELKEGE